MSRTLKVGTRGSTLATTQAGHVRDALIAAGHQAELVIVQTKGDVVMAPVERIGVGVFTLELRAALERGDCDIAVHSYKDLPTARDERFAPIAVPPRVDPSDVLIARDGLTMETLPEGACVGTSAPRRRSQLAALRPDLDLHPLRGNIDTRMGYVTSGDLDAVVLAAAGLDRTRVGARATHRFGIDEMLPAPAQGALAVEARVDDPEAIEALVVVDHLPTRVRIAAERRLLADLEAGCTAPVGARAELTGVVPADSAFAGTDPGADERSDPGDRCGRCPAGCDRCESSSACVRRHDGAPDDAARHRGGRDDGDRSALQGSEIGVCAGDAQHQRQQRGREAVRHVLRLGGDEHAAGA